jgi:cytochrome P450
MSTLLKPIDTPWGTYSVSFLFVLVVGGGYVFSLIVSRASLYLARRRFKNANGCLPCPKIGAIDPILGIDRVIINMRVAKEHNLLEFNKAHFDRLGHTFYASALGKTFFMTRDPENVKTILATKFNDFGLGNREKSLGHLLGRGIFTTDGERWAHSRAMIRPNFNRNQVADLEAFEKHIQTLFASLPRDGSTVDLQDLFFKFTIDSSTEFLFGKSTSSLESTLKGQATSESDFAWAFNHSQEYVAKRGRLGFLRRFFQNQKGEDAIRICHEFVDQFVDEAVHYREKLDAGSAENDDKYVFLYELAKETKDKRRLRDELLNVLLAGRDTTASLLSNMWFMLAKHPEAFAKLQQEVQDTFQGAVPTYEQLRNLKYLKWCMNECKPFFTASPFLPSITNHSPPKALRIHPVVPGNSRQAVRDTFLPRGGGPDGSAPVFVSAGSIVVYWPYAMHRRTDLYGADANEFRPERWETLRPGWEYLPFNGGPRICLGQQYALTEAGYVTVRLLQEFKELKCRDSGPWRENLTLTLCGLNGTKVGLIPADQ